MRESKFRIFDPTYQDCTTQREDLQLAITLNPLLSRIELAMDIYAEQFDKKEFAWEWFSKAYPTSGQKIAKEIFEKEWKEQGK